MMGPNSLDVKHPQCEFSRVDAALLVCIISPERHSSPLLLPERALHCKGYSPAVAPGFFSPVRVRGQPLALVAGWEVKKPRCKCCRFRCWHCYFVHAYNCPTW